MKKIEKKRRKKIVDKSFFNDYLKFTELFTIFVVQIHAA